MLMLPVDKREIAFNLKDYSILPHYPFFCEFSIDERQRVIDFEFIFMEMRHTTWKKKILNTLLCQDILISVSCETLRLDFCLRSKEARGYLLHL